MRRILWPLIVILVLAGAALLFVPNARERRLVHQVSALGGTIGVTYIGPDWVHDGFVRRWHLFSKPSHIDLSGCAVTDRDLECLSGMTRITLVDLTNTHIGDDGLEKLSDLPNLKKLLLEGTKVTDAGLAHLIGSTRPQILVLKDTQVTDAGLVRLGQMKWLACLDLGGTSVTDAGLEQLNGLVNLQMLTLKNTKITDAGLLAQKSSTGADEDAEFSDGADLAPWLKSILKSLIYLDVRGTKVTKEGLERLRNSFLRADILPRYDENSASEIDPADAK